MNTLLSNIQNKKIAKETIWSFATKAMTMLFFFGTDVILVRSLEDAYGTWSYFFSIMSVLFLFSTFGINSAVRTYVARYHNTDKFLSVLKSGLLLRLVITVSCAIVLIFFREYLALLLDRPHFAELFLIAVPLLIFTNTTEFAKQLFSGMHRIKYAFITNMTEYGTKFILVLAVMLSPTIIKSGLPSTISAYTIGVFLASLTSIVIITNYVRKEKINATVEHVSYMWKEILHYSFPLFFIAIGLIIATEIDVILLGRLVGDEASGIYAVSKKIITKVPQISLAIAAGSMPIFAKMTATTVAKDQLLFKRLIRINSLIFIPIALLILGTSWFFVPLIYGEQYSASVVPMNILVLYLLVYSYSIYLSTFLDYRKKAKKRALNLTIALILNIVLDIALIPLYGPSGAAIATSISYLPYLVLNWYEVHTEFNKIQKKNSLIHS